MLHLDNISVRFPAFVLEPLTLAVEKGDYMALLGVSGAGKTVVLELLAGLIRPDSGMIRLNGKDITGQRIQERRIGLVYQDLSLFPHLNVRNNIAYPLRRKGLPKSKLIERVSKLASQTEAEHLLSRYPGTLSGGEAQRVALARTLASDPEVLLLDEPLSNLDVRLRSDLRKLLRKIHNSGKTIIHVTHDYTEAATLANKVAVIQDGRLLQHGTPEEVFRHPRSAFVAQFSGIKNLFPCRSVALGSANGLQTALIGNDIAIQYVGDEPPDGGYVMIPEQDIFISLKPVETSAVNQLKGTIKETYMAGSGIELVVDAGEEFVVSISRQSQSALQLGVGKEIWLAFKASAVRFVAH